MKGFKDFLMRGNLVELAVAFVMAAAFGAVVTAFVQIILDIIGKAGGTPNFSEYTPGGIHVGVFITALIAFIILAAVVYFFVVKPYEAARARYVTEEEPAATEIDLLVEIRDALQARR
ncbi:MscL family protein [Segeticoccus rhizosphaerae]|jgi:large conductance mechanosensitive channel|uniref:MscL family protein n=1 Tax=Segeticoccus rhizosphaerae TaxID=1104777 RepID=UPI0010BFC3C8|nr:MULTISPECIES: MscL family protein [Intrasporangiaceae]